MKFAASAVVAFLAVTLVSGCGDSNEESTVSPEAGVSGQVGNVDIRDLFVLGGNGTAEIPAGGSAPVYLTMVNRPAGGEPDPTGGTAAAEADVLESVTSTDANSVELIGGPVQLPVGQDVRVGPDARIVLRGLTEALESDGDVDLTLKFQKAGSVTLEAPVIQRKDSYESYSPAP